MLALTLFVQVTSGCLSNEYRIPTDELARLAQAPVVTRGQHVHVVQGLGQRRSDAVTFRPPPPPLPLPPPSEDGSDVFVEEDPFARDGGNVQINLSIDSHGSGSPARPRGPAPGGGLRGPAPGGGLRGTPPHVGLRGTPPGAGWRGTPPAGGAGGVHPGGIGHTGGGGHSSSGWSGGGGGGGGGDGGAALAVLAVVLVAVAVVAGVSLVASEGMRFDGYTDMEPDQSIHLKNQQGAKATLSLAALTPDDVAGAVEATVKDDEDFGLARRDRAPLDRTGLAFKLELGSANFNHGLEQIAGMASQIQFGAFFTPSVGVMLDLGLSGGAVCCSSVLSRHALALEVQAFPWALGRLHIGAFVKGGVAIIGDSTVTESGPIVGGGALIELALTTRLALTFRAAANSADLQSGWSTAGAVTGGIAIY